MGVYITFFFVFFWELLYTPDKGYLLFVGFTPLKRWLGIVTQGGTFVGYFFKISRVGMYGGCDGSAYLYYLMRRSKNVCSAWKSAGGYFYLDIEMVDFHKKMLLPCRWSCSVRDPGFRIMIRLYNRSSKVSDANSPKLEVLLYVFRPPLEVLCQPDYIQTYVAPRTAKLCATQKRCCVVPIHRSTI